jgi:hypothetical protein
VVLPVAALRWVVAQGRDPDPDAEILRADHLTAADVDPYMGGGVETGEGPLKKDEIAGQQL